MAADAPSADPRSAATPLTTADAAAAIFFSIEGSVQSRLQSQEPREGREEEMRTMGARVFSSRMGMNWGSWQAMWARWGYIP
jgi:hypothetical protein